MTWILMGIHCHFSSQIDGSLVGFEIDTKFHDDSMSFIQVFFSLLSMLKHDMDFGFWTNSSHGISMTFARKMMGFPSDLASFLTKLP